MRGTLEYSVGIFGYSFTFDDEASLEYALNYRCLLVFRLNLIGWTWPLQYRPILCYAVIGFCILTQNWRTQYSSGETFPAAY